MVPSLNEEITVGEFVDWCKEGLERTGVRGQILIVDSSTDKTPEIVLAHGGEVLRTPKRGLGRAYIDATSYIRGQWIIMGDADLTYDFRELSPFVEAFRKGAEFVMVSKQPITGRDEAHLLVDRREELRELHMHCTLSGMFVHWQLTDAQGGTFVDAEFGMDPLNRRYQAFDFALGRRFFRRWLSEAMTGLKEAASPTRATS